MAEILEKILNYPCKKNTFRSRVKEDYSKLKKKEINLIFFDIDNTGIEIDKRLLPS